MAHRLRFHRSIPDDLAEALDYYDEISPALGDSFREKVDQRLDEIAENPELFPFDLPPIRFAKVDRFPYLIFFTAKPELVAVIAILHGASDPERWRDRV